ncbi:phospholipase D family protein [Pseudorhodoferax sp.]|uniref:phospholipase D family protein n=1 Tax=Pseudorhodoferax sp. TaxID=1993553 RepID=UPI002DD68FBE|nr:phospholipase D family protein [Pseudorhodoferax sp.]
MTGPVLPAWSRSARWLLLVCALALAAACATLPPVPASQAASSAIADFEASPLAAVAAAQTPADGRSGFLLQPYGPNALATRLVLARRATRSLDVQYYLLRADHTGLALMRALRDAAARGVRVRLLVDDFYTAGEDATLLALAQLPQVEVRLFNPFPAAREQTWTRFLAAAFDFGRVNRRMHNKLFIADNVAAVAGGRNMADEYVMNAEGANFIDMDVFATGPVVRDLSDAFDHYWNSGVVYDVRSVARSASTPAALLDAFERRSAAARPPQAVEIPPDGRIVRPDTGEPMQLSADMVAMMNLPFALERGTLQPLLAARAQVLFDPLSKTLGWNEQQDSLDGTVTQAVVRWMHQARKRIKIVSPYFIPSDASVQALAYARRSGVDVVLVTNSLASTDEPFVYFAYWSRLKALLRAGVQVLELSPSLSVERHRMGLFGHRQGALHMKNAVVDNREVFLGSLNLDPRSAKLNTELGLIIHSEEMAAQLNAFADDGSWYRLRLAAETDEIEWLRAEAAGGETVFRVPPETTGWQRLKLQLLGPFVPEKVL